MSDVQQSRFRQNRTGTTAIEYSVLVGLISLMCLTAWQIMGSNLSGMFYGRVAEVFTSASNGV